MPSRDRASCPPTASPTPSPTTARTRAMRGLRVIIAGAGLSAALPGVAAAHTDLPVIGVPLSSRLQRGRRPGRDPLGRADAARRAGRLRRPRQRQERRAPGAAHPAAAGLEPRRRIELAQPRELGRPDHGRRSTLFTRNFALVVTLALIVVGAGRPARSTACGRRALAEGTDAEPGGAADASPRLPSATFVTGPLVDGAMVAARVLLVDSRDGRVARRRRGGCAPGCGSSCRRPPAIVAAPRSARSCAARSAHRCPAIYARRAAGRSPRRRSVVDGRRWTRRAGAQRRRSCGGQWWSTLRAADRHQPASRCAIAAAARRAGRRRPSATRAIYTALISDRATRMGIAYRGGRHDAAVLSTDRARKDAAGRAEPRLEHLGRR